MRSRTRLNIALLGGLIIIAALFWLSIREESGGEPLLDRSPESMERLEVIADGISRWTAVQVAGRWRLIAPIAAPLHEERMARLLQLLRLPVHGRYPVDEVDPARFGLDEPVLELRVDGQRITIGDSEPVNRRRYVRLEEAVLMLDEVFYFQFDRPVEAIIDHRLLPPGAAIEAIEFPGSRLARGEDGRWQLSDGPDHLTVGDLEQLLSNWRQAEAPSVLAWLGETAHQDPDGDTVRVQLASGETRRFHVLSPEGELELASPETGLRYRFPSEQKAALLPDA